VLNDDIPDDPVEQLQMMESLLTERATGGLDASNAVYSELRRNLLAREDIKQKLPNFVRTCRSLDAFWPFIKNEFATYADRRGFISNAFTPVIDHLEARDASPADEVVSSVLSSLDEAEVHKSWIKALARRQVDPEGAITMARSLLESVCKSILDEAGKVYTERNDLPKLYHMTAKVLHLAPSQHQEEVFRVILGGCQSVVNGLGALRNQLGDSHGKGSNPVKPSARHANLAVNLAGAMATFLVETWQHRQRTNSE